MYYADFRRNNKSKPTETKMQIDQQDGNHPPKRRLLQSNPGCTEKEHTPNSIPCFSCIYLLCSQKKRAEAKKQKQANAQRGQTTKQNKKSTQSKVIFTPQPKIQKQPAREVKKREKAMRDANAHVLSKIDNWVSLKPGRRGVAVVAHKTELR